MFVQHGLLAKSEKSVAEKLRTRDQRPNRPPVECRTVPRPKIGVRKIVAPGGLKCAQIFLIAVNETDQDRNDIRQEVLVGMQVQFHSSGFAIEIGDHDQSLESVLRLAQTVFKLDQRIAEFSPVIGM